MAHALNTPRGNSPTRTTALSDRARARSEEVRSGTIKRSSLERAAELIADFNQVAMNQTSARRRQFDPAETLAELLKVLRPQFPTGVVDIREDMPPVS